MTPEEVIDLIVSRASDLRDAGVRRLELAGVCSVDIDPFSGGPMIADPEPQEEAESSDPLDDPHTFGLPDGHLPGFRRDEEGEP